jgi:acylphosphatase
MQQEDARGSPPEATVRRRYRVSGRVQGVGFRVWTVRRASALGLRGSVRNLGDGGVEVEAEGPLGAVQRLVELLRRGPALAQVREVRELLPGDDELPAGFDLTS